MGSTKFGKTFLVNNLEEKTSSNWTSHGGGEGGYITHIFGNFNILTQEHILGDPLDL